MGRQLEAVCLTDVGGDTRARILNAFSPKYNDLPRGKSSEMKPLPELHILVATDVLAEGVNLQASFQAVVHYDLAWNPTRHEQREGRVDRFGQRSADVRVVTIYGRDNGIDGKVLEVLIRKHREIRKSTGISVPVPDEADPDVPIYRQAKAEFSKLQ